MTGEGPEEQGATATADSAGSGRLLDLLLSPACRLDVGGVLLQLNDAWKAFAGPRAQTGMHWLDLLDAQEDRVAAASLLRQLPDGGAQQIECRLRSASGELRWFMLNLQPCLDGFAEESFLCIAIDIHAQHMREQELLLRANLRTSMLDGSADCIKLIGLDGHLIHMNKAGCEALGVTPGRFGMHWAPLLPPGVRQLADNALDEARQGRAARFLGSSEIPGQATRFWDNMLAPLRDVSGRTTAILCVSRDVTEELQMLDSLRHSKETLAIAARVGGLGIWDYDLKTDALRCDDGWYRIMGRDPATPIRSLAEFRPFIHPEDADRATEVEMTARELVHENRNYGIVFRILRPNGDIRWIRSTACLLQDEAGNSQRAVGFIVDVTDSWRGELALRDANRALEEKNESLARQILEDPLTGLANRRFLDSELARICLQAAQAPVPVAIAMVDVDYFKAYNDRYGHVLGDEALRGVATALHAIARRSDFVARYGGEEFVVVLPDLENPAPVLERLHAAIAELGLAHTGSPHGRITVSCGCVVFSSCEGFTPERLLRACDAALYEAKSLGRNRHVVRAAPRAEPG